KHPRGRKLPVAYKSQRRLAAVWVAQAVLELSAEACERTPLLDDPGAAPPCNRAISLGEPTAECRRTCCHSNLPPRCKILWRTDFNSAPAWQRGFLSAGRGDWPRQSVTSFLP